jgi:hypothetical protein
VVVRVAQAPQLEPVTIVVDHQTCILMVGPNFRVGKKIGCGNFGELRLGEFAKMSILFKHQTETTVNKVE